MLLVGFRVTKFECLMLCDISVFYINHTQSLSIWKDEVRGIYNCVYKPLNWLINFQEDAQEEFGWKLVHGDIFRPPRKGMLLSVFLGSGTQILIMTFVTLCKYNIMGYMGEAVPLNSKSSSA